MKAKQLIFLLSLITFLFLISAKKKNLSTVYSGHCHKDESFYLEISKDSNFIQKYRTIGTTYISQGFAFTKNDTLSLNIKKVFRLSKKEKIEVIDTSDYTYKLAHRFSNYLVKKDTVTILFKRSENNTSTIEWCDLAKK